MRYNHVRPYFGELDRYQARRTVDEERLELRCIKCEKRRPRVLFPRGRRSENLAICQICTVSVQGRYNKRRISSARARFLNSVPGSERYLKKRAYQLVCSARYRSAVMDIAFDLDVPWVLERFYIGRCEVTGILFDFQHGARGNFSPSVDRREPSKGYTKENTQMVVWLYNAAKGCGSHEDVLKLAEALKA